MPDEKLVPGEVTDTWKDRVLSLGDPGLKNTQAILTIWLGDGKIIPRIDGAIDSGDVEAIKICVEELFQTQA